MQINGRHVLGFDIESHLARRGLGAPPMVCLSLYCEGDALELVDAHLDRLGLNDSPEHCIATERGLGVGWLLSDVAARRAWPGLLTNDELHLAAHSCPFDLGVLAKETDLVSETFERFKRGTVSDTMIRERLAAIAMGHLEYDPILRTKDPRHNLAQVVKKRLGIELKGDKMKTPKSEKHDAWPWVCARLKCPDCELPPWMGIGHPNDSGHDCATCEGFGLTGPWRLRYCQLHGVPINRWPARAASYAVDDSFYVVLCARAQLDTPAPPDTGVAVVEPTGLFVDEVNQTRSWWSMALMALWGPRTNGKIVERVVADWTERAEAALAIGREAGFVRENGSENRKLLTAQIAAAYTASERSVPRTSPTEKMLEKADALAQTGKPDDAAKAAELRAGNIRYGAEFLADSGDEVLVEYAKGGTFKGYLSKYASTLQIGTTNPITSRPNPLVGTGRSGWTDPPMQGPPAKGGYRESHEPRAGFVYCSADYDAIELCSLAQMHIDWGLGSTMRDAIADGRDLHVDLAAEVIGITYEDAIERYRAGDELLDFERQRAKAANFGFPGGMGAKTCVATYGVETFSASGDYEEAIDEATLLKDIWKAKWPEMAGYFRIISNAIDAGATTATHAVTGMQRADLHYTNMCNTYFQNRTATGAKLGIWLLSLACYTDPDSPLYGTRPWLLLHDEVLAEMRRESVQLAAPEMARVLRDAMQEITPDVPISIEPNVTRRWYKKAKTVIIDGVLVPWEPWKKLREPDELSPGMLHWEDQASDARAVVYLDGTWRAFARQGLAGEGKCASVKLAKHRAECAALGEAPWV